MKKLISSFLLLFVLLVSGCQPASTTAPGNTPSPQSTNTRQPVTLRLAMLPILDALPIYVAQEKGYFEQAGLKVDFIPANSALERDQIMAAGQADGLINDLVSVVLYDRDQAKLQVVRFAQVASKDHPMFRIIASPHSGIKSPADLAGVEIGISQGSVIEYVTDRLLQAEGLSADQINTVAVPKIPDRLTLLENDGLKAATLPEPFSTQAINAGGTVIVDDSTHPEYGNSVISFTTSVIDAHPEAIKAFLAAVDKAVADINCFLRIKSRHTPATASRPRRSSMMSFPGRLISKLLPGR